MCMCVYVIVVSLYVSSSSCFSVTKSINVSSVSMHQCFYGGDSHFMPLDEQ